MVDADTVCHFGDVGPEHVLVGDLGDVFIRDYGPVLSGEHHSQFTFSPRYVHNSCTPGTCWCCVDVLQKGTFLDEKQSVFVTNSPNFAMPQSCFVFQGRPV